jgi:molybdopterin-guanine dinucleotide biosynthesis protein A
MSAAGGGDGRGGVVAAAIIAGGRGSRMGGVADGAGVGMNKGLLMIEDRRIVDRQLEVLRPCFEELVIVATDAILQRETGVRVVADRRAPGAGPLAGLEAALGAWGPEVGSVVCVAADMPFLSLPVLEWLRDQAPGAVAVVPRIGGHPEPLLARYSRACAPIVQAQLDGGAHAMKDLLARLAVVWVEEPALRALDPELRCLLNVNTPDDLAAAAAAARSGALDRGRRR